MNASLIQRSLPVIIGVAMCLTACGASTPEAIALTDEAVSESSATDSAATDSELPDGAVPDAELVSLPAAQVAAETSVPPTATSPDAADSVCARGADFPNFDGPIDVVNADMDQDGELDQIFLLAETNGLSSDAWIAVRFARGGIATGMFDGFFETSVVHDLRVVELTNGQGTSPEILFATSSGPAISQVAVMTVVDCEVVNTTLFGETFGYNVGASTVFASSAGCAYGTGGRLEFAVTEQNPSLNDWSTTVYTLDGSVWTRVDRYSESDFPDLESPTVLSMADCTGLTLAE